MARLIAKSPLYGVLPVAAGDLVLSEIELGPVTSLAPFAGREAEVSAALKAAFGFGFPEPNRVSGMEAVRCLWTGPGQALLLGAAAPEGIAGSAALTDQSDAWAALRLDGPGAEAVLARLVPLDLRPAQFPRGHTARTLLFHMTCSVSRLGPQAFEILTLRSMGRSAVHDLHEAMKGVSARG